MALLPIATATDWASSWRATGRYDARLVWASSSITGAAVGTTLLHLALGDWWIPATPWVAGVAILIVGSKLRSKIKARPAQDR